MSGDRATFTKEQLSAAVSAIRSYDAVVVLGAGASAFGYPMTGQLPALLWQAIADVEGAADELRRRTGETGSPKDILGTHPETVVLGWQLARDLPQVSTAFKRAFASLDADREPSLAHFNLARLIHEDKVQFVVSYNWDSCLERAYEQLFGTTLAADGVTLAKPHGDVADPDERWVLPDEAGLVPDQVRERMAQLDDRPRVLIVLGYSGSDEYVVKTLLAPLEGRWPVVRVGPTASGEGAVPGTADEVSSALVAQLLADAPAPRWRHVTFTRSRDFSAALRGERLGPADVDSCPELPAAARLADRLRSSRYATLSGESGSGKSITAFHAVRHLNRDGWAVVELVRPGVATLEEVEYFARMRGPVVAVVDDAQAIAPEVLAEFERSIDRYHAVLLVSTQRLERRGDETLSASRALEVIYEHCLVNIETIGPLLTQLDDRVGKSAFKETPQFRLKIAHDSSKMPWVFTFVASGGERRLNGALDRLVEHKRAALIFGLICVGQIVSRDAGVTLGQLEQWHTTFAPDRTTSADLADTLEELSTERLLLERSGQIRAAHIRIADWALRALGKRSEADIGATLLAFVRAQLLDSNVSVIGKYWLVRAFDRDDSYRYRLRERFLDADVVRSVVDQCLEARSGRDRRVALLLIWTVDFMSPVNRALAERVAARVIEWLPDVNADEVSGFKWILSGLRARHEDLHKQVRESWPAHDLARIVSTRGTRPSGPSWADLIGEFCPPVEDPNHLPWVAAFTEGVDPVSLRSWLSATDADSHPEEIYDLVTRLAEVSPPTASSAFAACFPHLKQCLEQDLAEATHGIARWAFGAMYMVAHLADAPGIVDPDIDEADVEESTDGSAKAGGQSESDHLWAVYEPELRELAARILTAMESVDWERAAASLLGTERYEVEHLDLFFFWLGSLSVDLVDRIVEGLPDDWLDQLTADDADGLEQIAVLLYSMSPGGFGSGKVRRLIERGEVSLESFPSVLIDRFPDIAVRMVQAGKSVRLESPRGGSWEPCTTALRALATVNRDAAIRVLAESTDHLREALEKPQSHDLSGLAAFVKTADSLDSGILDELFAALDADVAVEWWSRRISDSFESVSVLLHRAALIDGEIGNLARSLLTQ